MIKFIGEFTVNPFFYITGKISGYITWLYGLLHILNLNMGSYIYIIGLLIVLISWKNLGNSTSFGVPKQKTILKTNGLYKISRNPMYIGFNLLTMSSIMIQFNIIILIIGIYSIIVYHFIILGEEKFLKKRFGKEYTSYSNKVRRYF
ncbi:isoprenylcysteine carboxylmethyltransferase family protein [Candidatus Woesearchaeota archaeon]|nr:isoprenylcysteine carboxylmethyltransferase family protein [Candidatus Woesearchaeota archaeon]